MASVHAGGPSGVPPAIRVPLNPQSSSNAKTQPSEPLKTSLIRVYVQNIGWASKVRRHHHNISPFLTLRRVEDPNVKISIHFLPNIYKSQLEESHLFIS